MVEVFYHLAKDAQNCSGQNFALEAMEDCCLHEYFRIIVHVAIITWTMLTDEGLMEEGTEISHVLWEFYCMKCYLKIGQGCPAGNRLQKGDVDPKIWCRHSGP